MEPGLAQTVFTCPGCSEVVQRAIVTGSRQEHGVAMRDLKRRYPELHRVVVLAGPLDGERQLWVRCPRDAHEHERALASDTAALGQRAVAARAAALPLAARSDGAKGPTTRRP